MSLCNERQVARHGIVLKSTEQGCFLDLCTAVLVLQLAKWNTCCRFIYNIKFFSPLQHLDSPLYNDPPSAYSITRQTWVGKMPIEVLRISDLNFNDHIADTNISVNLLDFCMRHTTSRYCGGSHEKAVGAGDKEEK